MNLSRARLFNLQITLWRNAHDPQDQIARGRRLGAPGRHGERAADRADRSAAADGRHGQSGHPGQRPAAAGHSAGRDPGAERRPSRPQAAPDVAEEAADAVEADAVAQTRVQAAAQGEAPTATTPPPAAAAPPAAPVQAQAQPPAPPAVPTGPVARATAADLRTGVQVRDQSGGLVGTVETADAGGAVVNTGAARARIVLSSFGRNNQGLVISMTKAQFEAAASAANPS